MELIIKRILLFLIISATPMIIVTAIWILTAGYFNWLSAVHSDPYAIFTSFAVLFGLTIALCVPDYELQR